MTTSPTLFNQYSYIIIALCIPVPAKIYASWDPNFESSPSSDSSDYESSLFQAVKRTSKQDPYGMSFSDHSDCI